MEIYHIQTLVLTFLIEQILEKIGQRWRDEIFTTPI